MSTEIFDTTELRLQNMVNESEAATEVFKLLKDLQAQRDLTAEQVCRVIDRVAEFLDEEYPRDRREPVEENMENPRRAVEVSPFGISELRAALGLDFGLTMTPEQAWAQAIEEAKALKGFRDRMVKDSP